MKLFALNKPSPHKDDKDKARNLSPKSDLRSRWSIANFKKSAVLNCFKLVKTLKLRLEIAKMSVSHKVSSLSSSELYAFVQQQQYPLSEKRVSSDSTNKSHLLLSSTWL